MSDAARERSSAVQRLRLAGCVAAEEEADELWSASSNDHDRFRGLVDRRCVGEPLAWVTGSTSFAGETVRVDTGVYVPRWQSEALVELAVARLPDDGVAIDLCTGSGALAMVIKRRRPSARVLAGDIDPIAVACARSNGVDAVVSDMASALLDHYRGRVDVVVGVVPYVPSDAMYLLSRDSRDFEPVLSLDGGRLGTELLTMAIADAAALLRPGGTLLLELGHGQVALIEPTLTANGFSGPTTIYDEDHDERGIWCTRQE